MWREGRRGGREGVEKVEEKERTEIFRVGTGEERMKLEGRGGGPEGQKAEVGGNEGGGRQEWNVKKENEERDGGGGEIGGRREGEEKEGRWASKEDGRCPEVVRRQGKKWGGMREEWKVTRRGG